MKKNYVINDEKIEVIVQDLRNTLKNTKFSEEEIEKIVQEAIEKEEERYFCTAEEARAEINKALNKDISESTFRRIMSDYDFITKKKSNKTGLRVAIQSVDEYIEYSQYKTNELIAQIKALKEQLKEKDFQLMDEESRNGKLQEEVEKYKTILQEQTILDDFVEVAEEVVISSNENVPKQAETKENEGLSVEELLERMEELKLQKKDIINAIRAIDPEFANVGLSRKTKEYLMLLLRNRSLELYSRAIIILTSVYKEKSKEDNE